MAIRAIETGPGEPGEPPAVVRVHLDGAATLGGQIVDRAGKPRPGALVSFMAGRSARVDWNYDVPAAARPGGNRNRVRMFLPTGRDADTLLSLTRKEVRCDARGRFMLPMPRVPLGRISLITRHDTERGGPLKANDNTQTECQGRSVTDVKARLGW